MDFPSENPIGYASYPDEAQDVEQQDRLLAAESFDGRTPVRSAWFTELSERRIAVYFSIIA